MNEVDTRLKKLCDYSHNEWRSNFTFGRSLVQIWRLREALPYRDGEVPAGYSTDLGSTPSFVWGVYPPWRISPRACIVHDWNYGVEHYGNPRKEPRSIWGAMHSEARERADELFYSMMLEDGESEFDCAVYYQAVRKFGWNVWRRHTLETVLAERRKYGYGLNS